MSAAIRPATSIGSNDVPRLMCRVKELLDGGQTKVARPVFAALQRIATPSAQLSELEIRLLVREGRFDEARAASDEALAMAPDMPSLRLLRADLRLRAGDNLEAAEDAAEAVILDSSSAYAKSILGIALLGLGRVTDAIACFSEALAKEPGRVLVRLALADAQERSGARAVALATLSAGIVLAPLCARLHIEAIRTSIRCGRFAEAESIAAEAFRVGAIDKEVLSLHGTTLLGLGRSDEASGVFDRARKLAPEDVYIREMVSILAARPDLPRDPAPYVEAMFDVMAAGYEEHVIGQGYRVPGMVRSALIEYFGETALKASGASLLDLGCGTGFVGTVLSDFGFPVFAGVDLSTEMLRQAQAKQIYSELRHEDLDVVLSDTGRCWTVIVAADVLCFFGALHALLPAIVSRLAKNGVFVCSFEEWQPDGVEAGEADASEEWRRGNNGRYVHRLCYVERMAAQAGLETMAARRDTLRFEDEQPVVGLFFVFRRPGRD